MATHAFSPTNLLTPVVFFVDSYHTDGFDLFRVDLIKSDGTVVLENCKTMNTSLHSPDELLEILSPVEVLK